MKFDWEIFKGKYGKASSLVQAVLNSEEIPNFLGTLQPNLQNDTLRLQTAVNLCSYYILDIITKETFVTELGFSKNDTGELLEKIASLLENKELEKTAKERLQSISPIPETPKVAQTDPEPQPTPMATIPDADNTIRDELLLKPRMTEKIVDRSIPQPGAKPLTREDILQSLAAKRTLASDVSALQQNGE